jgi:hypothetical protein
LDAQEPKVEIEKPYDKLGSEKEWLLIQKKNGNKIGFIGLGVSRGCARA